MPPKRPLRICPQQGCFKIVSETHCWEHKPEPFKRPDNYVRNKFYDSRAWRKTSKNHLNQFPLCVHCKQNRKVTPAVHTDHIIPIEQGGSPLDSDNLNGLCLKCHNTKSATERK